MSKLASLLLLIFLFGFQNSFSLPATNLITNDSLADNTRYNNDTKIEQLLTELSIEISNVKTFFGTQKQDIYTQLNFINKNLITETVL